MRPNSVRARALSFLPVPASKSPVGALRLLQSGHTQHPLASPPAPSGRNSSVWFQLLIGARPIMQWRRGENSLSLPLAPAGCRGKYLLICKWTKVKREIWKYCNLGTGSNAFLKFLSGKWINHFSFQANFNCSNLFLINYSSFWLDARRRWLLLFSSVFGHCPLQNNLKVFSRSYWCPNLYPFSQLLTSLQLGCTPIPPPQPTTPLCLFAAGGFLGTRGAGTACMQGSLDGEWVLCSQ